MGPKLNRGTRLNPAVFKTFIPDQLRQGNDVEGIKYTRFLEENKMAIVESVNETPIRTFDFIRQKISNVMGLINQ